MSLGRRCAAPLFVALLLAGWRTGAHQPGLSTLFVQLQTNTLAMELIVSWQEIETIIPLDGDQDGQLGDDEFAAAQARLLSLAESAVGIEADGVALTPTKAAVFREDTTGIRFTVTLPLPPVRVLLIRSDILLDLQRGHKQVITVRDQRGVILTEWVLERDRNMIEVPLAPPAGSPEGDRSIRQFLWLGIEHIVTGWDHVAFLFGLLVVGGKLREAIKIITSFTVAHSLTLALATLDVIRFSSRAVEPLIAASIVYVGIENILRHDYRGRWVLTFAFGLIHGCGFASVLRELGVGAHGSSVVKPLICFNAGVELGQLAIAAVMLPLIWALRPKFTRAWVPATSMLVVLLGAYWLVERTLL